MYSARFDNNVSLSWECQQQKRDENQERMRMQIVSMRRQIHDRDNNFFFEKKLLTRP